MTYLKYSVTVFLLGTLYYTNINDDKITFKNYISLRLYLILLHLEI